jgi:hypothetical protein
MARTSSAAAESSDLYGAGVKDVALVPARPEAEGLALVIERLSANPNVDVDKLERIILLQERINQHEAKAAFDAAFSRMQADLPVIAERGKTDKAKYATLEDIVEAVRPVLAVHQFALSHRTEWPDPAHVKIVGILAHAQGHEKTSEFLTVADTSGSKNAIQALGSALSYGRRYTTLDLLNIVSRHQDDDGATSQPKATTPEPPKGYEDWCDNMIAVADEGFARLADAFKASPEAFRVYTDTHRVALKEGWKAKAKAADKRRAARG